MERKTSSTFINPAQTRGGFIPGYRAFRDFLKNHGDPNAAKFFNAIGERMRAHPTWSVQNTIEELARTNWQPPT